MLTYRDSSMNITKLIAILRAHDQVARVLPNGDIEVDAVYCRDGKAYSQPEILKPTAKAIFDFLGY